MKVTKLLHMSILLIEQQIKNVSKCLNIYLNFSTSTRDNVRTVEAVACSLLPEHLWDLVAQSSSVASPPPPSVPISSLSGTIRNMKLSDLTAS